MTTPVQERRSPIGDGERLTRRYDFQGTAPPAGDGGPVTILGLHMLGLDGRSFENLARHLPANWTLVSFDQRGHGALAETPPRAFGDFVDDARSVLKTIQAPEVHLLGCSMGGSVAALLAHDRPEGAIASLTLVATPAKGHRVFADRANAQAEGSLESVIETTMERWFASHQDHASIAAAQRSLRNMTLAGYDACWTSFASFEGYEALGNKLPPTCCLAFEEDRSTPPAEVDRIATTLEAAGVSIRRRRISGAGHAGLLTHGREVAACLLEHCLSSQP